MRGMLTMIALTLGTAANAAEPEAHVFKADGKTLPYRVLKPSDPETGEKYPLV